VITFFSIIDTSSSNIYHSALPLSPKTSVVWKLYAQSNSLDLSTTTDPYEEAWQRLISHSVPQGELLLLIETIFSDKKRTDMVKRLQVSDAQAFVDIIDEVSHWVIYSQGIVGLLITQPSTLSGIG